MSWGKAGVLAAVILILLVFIVSTSVTAQTAVTVVEEPFMISNPAIAGCDEYRSVVAVDHLGNAHLAWVWTGQGDGKLIYTMVDQDGNTLIAPTALYSGGEDDVKWIRLAVDSFNCLHIVFVSWAFQADNPSVVYLKVNPYLDDLDGGQADPGSIVLVGPKMISPDGVDAKAPAIAVDKFDRVHVVWRQGWAEEYGILNYTRLDVDGNIEIGPVKLVDIYIPYYANKPSIATDSHGNVHIVLNDWHETSETEIAYMMVDGDTGDLLIGRTILTEDDDVRSRRPMIVVDSQDCAHIVWQDRRDGQTEIYYTKINPYLDDLDGDAADPSVITVIDDTRLSENDGYKSKHPALTIDQYDRLSIIWWDEKWLDAADSELSYMALDPNGAILVGEMRITWDGPDVDKYDDTFVPWIAAGGGVRVFITYTTDDIDGLREDEIWLIVLELPPPPVVGGLVQTVDKTRILMYVAVLAAAVVLGVVIVLRRKF